MALRWVMGFFWISVCSLSIEKGMMSLGALPVLIFTTLSLSYLFSLLSRSPGKEMRHSGCRQANLREKKYKGKCSSAKMRTQAWKF